MPNSKLVEQSQNLSSNKLLLEHELYPKCENCEMPLTGDFCSHCGQNSEPTLKYFWIVILHLLDDIFSFDSRASRTIWPLLTRPGFLTTEYIAGRRVHYVPPLRLYLFISIVFFITLNLLLSSENNSLININDQQSAIEKVTQHINQLEIERNSIAIGNPINSGELKRITGEIDKFSAYKIDLSKKENLFLNELVNEIISIELRSGQDNRPLSEKRKQRLKALEEKLIKGRKGELTEFGDNAFIINNNIHEKLSFDFLSNDNSEKLNKYIERLNKKAKKAFQSDTRPLIQGAIEKLPQLMFILLPLFALLLKITFIFSKRLYMEHLTVALHSHSFIFLSILLVELLSVFESMITDQNSTMVNLIDIVSLVVICWLPIYLFIMQKRVYKQGYFLTTVKYVLISTCYMILIAVTAVTAFIWGLIDI